MIDHPKEDILTKGDKERNEAIFYHCKNINPNFIYDDMWSGIEIKAYGNSDVFISDYFYNDTLIVKTVLNLKTLHQEIYHAKPV